MLRNTDHLTLAHGACVVLELVDDVAALARLPAAEQHRALELGPVRRREYIAGRTALHLALASAARTATTVASAARAPSATDAASTARAESAAHVASTPRAPSAMDATSIARAESAAHVASTPRAESAAHAYTVRIAAHAAATPGVDDRGAPILRRGGLAGLAGRAELPAILSDDRGAPILPPGGLAGLAERAELPAILSDDRGAPILPPGWVGSISHKGAFAAALTAPAGHGHIGLDLERAQPSRQDIARRILTPREQAALPDRARAVTLRFAIKEAIYKALDPYVRRYVGFTEVELDLAGDVVTVTTDLPFAIEATWREHAGHWLATARALPLGDR